MMLVGTERFHLILELRILIYLDLGWVYGVKLCTEKEKT